MFAKHFTSNLFMKTSLFKTVFFSMLLVLLGQCTSDRPQNLIAPRLTAEQLASNADFVEIVKITNHFQDVLYNNLRSAHSQRVRDASLRRISAMLSHQDNKDSVVMAIRKMGFSDISRFLLDLNQANLFNSKLQRKGIKLTQIQPDLLAEACGLASEGLGHKYPTVSPDPLGRDDICEECNFNNCNECGPGQTGGESTDETEDTGGYSCRSEAGIRRQNSINIASAAFIAALTGCGWTGVDVGLGTTGVLIETGPAAPVFGTVAGVATAGGCMFLATWTYNSAVNIIESTYRTDMAGCRN